MAILAAQGKEREIISAPNIYTDAQHNGSSDNNEYLMSILYFSITSTKLIRQILNCHYD